VRFFNKKLPKNMKNKSFPISVWVAFVGVCLIWGTTFLGIKYALDAKMPPFLLSALRHLIAGVLFLFIFYRRGMTLPSRRDLGWCVLNGFLLITGGNALVCWAETYISSGLAGILCAMSPIYITFMSLLFFKNARLTFKILLGLFLGISGLVLLSLPSLRENGGVNIFTTGALMITFANLMWGLANIFIKKYPLQTPIYIGMGLQMVAGGLINLTISLIFEPQIALWNYDPMAWKALTYLIIVGSIGGYGCYMYVLQYMPPARASIHTYINTLVAVIVGWFLYNEKMTIETWLAMAVVMIGVLLVNSEYARMTQSKQE
jgi:drug/metabolite transporter (DMT)-like permease